MSWSEERWQSEWGFGLNLSFVEWRYRASYLAGLIDDEQAWCDSDEGVRELHESNLDSGEAARKLSAPVSAEAMKWVVVVAGLLEQERGVAFVSLPEIRVISLSDLRRLGCHAVELDEWGGGTHGDSSAHRAATLARFEALLGLRNDALTPQAESHLLFPLIGGWYDDGAVYVVGEEPLMAHHVTTVSHELVHFQQDQQSDVALIDFIYGHSSSESEQIRLWLVEGEASALEIEADHEVMEPYADLIDWSEPFADFPELAPNAFEALIVYDIDQLFAEYTSGKDFVTSVLGSGGWGAIDALFEDPPDTMEQVLHPDKLAARERALELPSVQDIHDAVATDEQWSEAEVDTLGEWWLRSLLTDSLGRSHSANVAEAAAGWGADRLLVWEGEQDSQLAIWQVAFDTAVDHAEGAAALREWLLAQSDGDMRAAVGLSASASAWRWDGRSWHVRLLDFGQSLWLIAADSAEDADAALLDLLSLAPATYW
ncbi:MAG: hypothetical protein OXH38_03540 [Chloroflexi bacterium]|nr:hypothetical protein [Chloroflexota bacterium]